jgi:hypothetical protein
MGKPYAGVLSSLCAPHATIISAPPGSVARKTIIGSAKSGLNRNTLGGSVGEVVVIKDGRTDFSELQAELGAGRQDKLDFYPFDLLYLNGFDLRGARQIERKAALANLLEGIEAPVVYSEHLVDDGRRCSSTRPS